MKKRKLISVILSLLILCSVFSACSGKTENEITEASTEEMTSEEAAGIDVYVSIAYKTPMLTWVKVNVTDADEDGIFTICDALYCAHEQYFDGGVDGFGFEETEYGLSLTELGGMEGTAFGYYLNNASAMSLADEVKNNDCVYAFAYADAETYSDVYCYFNENTLTAAEGEEYTLTLTSVGFDENWAPVATVLEGAEITVDGEKTGVVTDAEGKAVLTLTEGEHIISAVSDTMTIVPPVCTAKVTK